MPTSSLHGTEANQHKTSVVELLTKNLELREQLRELEEVCMCPHVRYAGRGMYASCVHISVDDRRVCFYLTVNMCTY